MTAQDAYRELLTGHVGPGLRAEGLTGSGSVWTLPSDTHWVTVGFHASQTSTADRVTFTADLRVLSKALWAAEDVPAGRCPARPAATADYGLGWFERVGALLPGSSGDHWWSVTPDDEPAPLAADVLAALRDHALPAARRVLEEERAHRPPCSRNVGGRNWYRPCEAPADVAFAGQGRRVFRCSGHADEPSTEHDGTVLGRWPDLV
ncbi:DUF4304 domain-containing protein [Modestobacter versicolor]|uniref:Uncharacterized protein n=1 Tax=Modestobacter versicolor TaxID=429133 RepID=A0A839Y8M2_9ACTN|nr:DUF4304 domain-containing protein [Modestobacter versicolor]MBB3676654.1 hypothetical protein [Modestobacter versicolor]